MGSSTCGKAGSMPETTLARGPLALDKEFLAYWELSSFQREVAGRLLRIVAAMPPQSVTVRAAITQAPKATVFVSFVPRQEESAEMTIEIEQDTYVHIGVGEGTTYSLPHDVWDARSEDVLRFTEQIVSAVVAGQFQETVHYRGGVAVRWVSELRVEDTPVRQDRTEVLDNLRGILRKRTKREVTYVAYA